jgi:tRNA(Ile)-lysidine synthase
LSTALPPDGADRPIGGGDFAAAMAALGPFETAPRLAVAVSGGADSMTLLVLTREWAVQRGGQVVALTVDHGLRTESAIEAGKVARWVGALGVAHQILPWHGPKPAGDVQAAARAARYRLLEGWCAEAGVFHLLLAHQQDDQAETFLLRLARGSGLDGLAAMASVVERPNCRLLRPLLNFARARLVATVRARGQVWLDDPSNENPRFARVRLRDARAVLAREGLGAERLAATARRLAWTRQATESSLARLLARAAEPDPAGFVHLDAAVLAAAPRDLGLRALAAVLTAVAGADYPPRLKRLERLHDEMAAGLTRGRTLGGCRIIPRRGKFLVCREPRAMATPVAAMPGERTRWDGRFGVALAADAPAGLRLGPLGPDNINHKVRAIPAAPRNSVAALRDNHGIIALLGLGYRRKGVEAWLAAGAVRLRATRPATGAGTKVV